MGIDCSISGHSAIRRGARAAVALACLLAATGAAADGRRPAVHSPADRPILLAEHGDRMSREERQRLRDDVNSTRRELYRDRRADPGPPSRPAPGSDESDGRRQDPDRQARRMEAERLRDEVRAGKITREDAFRQYRERFGEPGPHRHAPHDAARSAEIERLREAVRSGQMRPEEAREKIRAQRMQRAMEASRLSPEEREQLRRDVMESNRDLQRR